MFRADNSNRKTIPFIIYFREVIPIPKYSLYLRYELFSWFALLIMYFLNSTFITSVTRRMANSPLLEKSMNRAYNFNLFFRTVVNRTGVIIFAVVYFRGFRDKPCGSLAQCMTIADIATWLTALPCQMFLRFNRKFTVFWTNYNYRGRAVHILNLAVIIPPIVNFIGSADKLLSRQLLRHISVCLVIGTKNGAGYVANKIW